MEGLHCEPCQIGTVETKTHKEGEALEEDAIPTETWSENSNKTTNQVHSSELVIEDATISSPFSEPLLGLILKTPATLQPVCFSSGPIMLPVEVQLVGGVQPQTTATPIITSAPGCLTLPPIFDQAHVQYLSSLSSCPITEQQNFPYFLQQDNELPQNLSCLAKGQSQSGDGKSNISEPSENSTMHSSEFLAALQELLYRNYSCRGSSSVPLNAFSTGFISPNITHSQFYTSSSLVSLFPPATLLVPFPFIVPLPMPLPIPIPFPFFLNPGSFFRPSHTIKMSKSTQTMTEDIPVSTHNKLSGYDFLRFPAQPPPPVSQEQVLDLTVKVVPIQTKQEVQLSFHQDSILDLSMANKSHSETGKDTKLKHPGRNSTNEDSTKLFRAVKRSQTQRTYRSHGYSDVEFNMQYKWAAQERYENHTIKYSGQNGRTQMQIPKFPRPNTDTSVTYCEKLARPPEGRVLKNRAVKQRKLNTQNLNLPPIKKQHFMVFHPSK